MVKIRKYKVGTYTSTGKPVRRNKTYRGKPTKAVKAKNMLKAKIVLFIGLIAISNAILVQNNSYNIESVGGVVEAQNTEEAETAKQDYSTVGSDKINFAPLAVEIDYENIPYITKKMEISHYSELDSCHYPVKDGCLTASGKVAEVRMVATNLYPFGTKLLINGKEYVVEDRISKRYNNRIDIFTGYGQRAYNLAKDEGIKYYEVAVID